MDCCQAFEILSEVGDKPEFYESQLGRHDILYEGLVDRVGLGRGARALDLGTGTGPVAIKLAQRVGPEGNITGIDVNKRMLHVARGKAIALGMGNIEFKHMSMENLKFRDDSFDHVVSSYGVCCCFHYDLTLGEAFRVLKPGGRISFSQAGPKEGQVQRVYDRVFSKYKTRRPSLMLRKRREASSLQEKMVRRYQRATPLLALMKKIGFRGCTHSISKFELRFSSPEEFLDYNASDSYEYEEMTLRQRSEFRDECVPNLKRFQGPGGFVERDETAFFSGIK